MAAMDLDWIPQSLYGISLTVAAKNFPRLKHVVSNLPLTLQFDVYNKVFQLGGLCTLGTEFSNLDTFAHVLLVKHKRLALHQCFQGLRDNGIKISEILSQAYVERASRVKEFAAPDYGKKCNSSIVLGFHLGGFLADAGWNLDAAKVYSSCYDMCLIIEDLEKAFCCCTKLLHVYNANCMYKEAEDQFLKAQKLFQRLQCAKPNLPINLASLFAEYGAYHFAKSEYDKAYKWSIEALKMLKKPGRFSQATVVDVLRLASRACVVKRHFNAAERLVQHAVILSREAFGKHHLKYSSTLLDYGFYLLNIDNVCQSQRAYQTALVIRQNIFGGQNLHVAVAHEDLAYASYVHQYSTGRFEEAKSHADAAIKILSKILPPDHLLLASSNRVKALILEEIAIDSHSPEHQKRLLEESHSLHQQSLKLAKKAFGEKNVQTAKHYGNLGRLYQSMELFEKAEEMHLRAIAIKEELLGPNDYEVALSVGHIASLYNYDMKQYQKAEKLYLRSIAIARQLYGDGYSGLEYDYRGLIKIYASLGDFEKLLEYDGILTQWQSIRERRRSTARDEVHDLLSNSHVYEHCDAECTGAVIDDFFEKIEQETQNTVNVRMEDVHEQPRTRQDIAFNGPIHEAGVTARAQSRGNDHRNVGDGAYSHPPVCVNTPSTSSQMQVDSIERGNEVSDENDVSKALKLFNVMPDSSEKLLKFKKFKKE